MYNICLNKKGTYFKIRFECKFKTRINKLHILLFILDDDSVPDNSQLNISLYSKQIVN